MTKPARQLHTQQVHYMRRQVSFDTQDVGLGVALGTLPAGAFVLGLDVAVEEAFNAATTNVLEVGTSGTPGKYVGSGDVNEAAVGVTSDIATGAGLVSASADEEVLVRYTFTGGAPTAGRATICLRYIPDNDG